MDAVQRDFETIFAEAIEIASAEERARFLAKACAHDPELHRQMGKLVDDHFRAGAFLEEPAMHIAATMDAPPAEKVGTMVGPYKLLEQIGEGGMGLVYVAEQDKPLKRRVALKIIKPGMDSKQVIARFEAERQALALMDHPHIARVYDAGTTAEGRPYFVMELVKGIPITDYCDQQRLGTRERLTLFLDVCQAVQHAHQKGIIHRDLKPSNVLVSRHDTTPVVKVIDFGIAKATGGRLSEHTVYTAFAQMLGTPLYMSPEQAGLSDLDVDTRSDVYSLGVLLYELLSGTTPFDSETFKKVGYDELRRIIREEDPPRPSTRLSTMAQAHLSTIAQRRGLEPRRLTGLVRGELDWIVMKALEKDRNRRYESASAFAADVQRYLNDEPVQACPPSQLYRLRKLARRHKAGLGVTALLLVAVLLGASSWLWWLQQRGAAEGEARLALAEATTLLEAERWPEALSAARRADGILAGFAADAGLRQQARVLIEDLEMAGRLQAAALRRTAVKDGHFDAEAADAAYKTAFETYGLDVDALDPSVAAERIRARPIHQGLVAALDNWACVRRGQNAEGWRRRLAVARLADPNARRNRLRDVLKRKDAKKALAEIVAAADENWPVATLVLLGKVASATFASGERVALLLGRAQQRHPDDFWINESLGRLLQGSRPPRPEEALRFLSVAVALQPHSPGAHVNLGNALQEKGRVDEAIAEFREAIRLKNDYFAAHLNLGGVLRDKRQLDEAIAEYRAAIRLKKDSAEAHNNLGNALRDKGRLDDAIAECREAIRLKKDYVEAHNDLGGALHEKGRLDEAIAECREAIRLKKDYAEAHSNLGGALYEKGRLDEAIAECREAIRLKKDYAEAHSNLGVALRENGQLDEAIAEYHTAIRLKKDYAEAHSNLGVALQEKGRVDEAIAECRAAVRLKKDLAEAHNNLGNALQLKGQLDQAIAECREAIRLKKDYVEAHNDLGYALMKEGRLDEAIAECHAAIRLKKDYAGAHINLGIALQLNGQLDEAIAEYHTAIRLKKDSAEAHNNLGDVLRRKGRLDEAIAEFRAAVRLNNGFPIPHSNLGVALQDKGQLAEAVTEYRAAIRLKNDYALAHCNLAWLLATSSDVHFHDPKQALAHAKKAVELAPGDGKNWKTLGVAQYHNGAWKAAVTALMKSVQIRDGGDGVDYFFLAMAYWQLHQREKARAWYDRGVAWMDKHNPKDEELKRFRAEATTLVGVGKAGKAPQPKKQRR